MKVNICGTICYFDDRNHLNSFLAKNPTDDFYIIDEDEKKEF